jgi:hypothetical protein
MTRVRLPTRRAGETFDIEHDGQKFTICVGQQDGYPVEVFCNAAKADSMIGMMASEAAILISNCLRHGAPLARLRGSVHRDEFGKPATVFGAILDAMEGR